VHKNETFSTNFLITKRKKKTVKAASNNFSSYGKI